MNSLLWNTYTIYVSRLQNSRSVMGKHSHDLDHACWLLILPTCLCTPTSWLKMQVGHEVAIFWQTSANVCKFRQIFFSPKCWFLDKNFRTKETFQTVQNLGGPPAMTPMPVYSTVQQLAQRDWWQKGLHTRYQNYSGSNSCRKMWPLHIGHSSAAR